MAARARAAVPEDHSGITAEDSPVLARERPGKLSRDAGATEREATVHEAKTHLSRLLAEVEAGGTVVITRRGKPVARLVTVRRRPVFGSMKGRFAFDESFFDALPDDELKAWEGG